MAAQTGKVQGGGSCLVETLPVLVGAIHLRLLWLLRAVVCCLSLPPTLLTRAPAASIVFLTQAGKGRTGLVCSAFFLHEALAGTPLMHDGEAVDTATANDALDVRRDRPVLLLSCGCARVWVCGWVRGCVPV